jgi:8-oxo-dGTP pyrophosphatase MutT (NUDIX family)
MPSVPDARPPIRTVAALIRDAAGRVLLVRKRGSTIFIQPGGKPEPGEAPLATLARELVEELGARPVPGTIRPLGEFEDEAVHETGLRVRATVYACAIDREPVAGAEIEELAWVDPSHPGPMSIAPLSRRRILPAVAARDGG